MLYSGGKDTMTPNNRRTKPVISGIEMVASYLTFRFSWPA
jgi:hypothetical protein